MHRIHRRYDCLADGCSAKSGLMFDENIRLGVSAPRYRGFLLSWPSLSSVREGVEAPAGKPRLPP